MNEFKIDFSHHTKSKAKPAGVCPHKAALVDAIIEGREYTIPKTPPRPVKLPGTSATDGGLCVARKKGGTSIYRNHDSKGRFVK